MLLQQSSKMSIYMHVYKLVWLLCCFPIKILLRRLDGFDTQSDKTVLICATNRERDLDEAFRSRVDVTVYFPLPEHQGRCHIIKRSWDPLINQRERCCYLSFSLDDDADSHLVCPRYAKHLTEKEVDTLANYTTNLSGRNIRVRQV